MYSSLVRLDSFSLTMTTSMPTRKCCAHSIQYTIQCKYNIMVFFYYFCQICCSSSSHVILRSPTGSSWAAALVRLVDCAFAWPLIMMHPAATNCVRATEQQAAPSRWKPRIGWHCYREWRWYSFRRRCIDGIRLLNQLDEVVGNLSKMQCTLGWCDIKLRLQGSLKVTHNSNPCNFMCCQQKPEVFYVLSDVILLQPQN